MPVPAAQSPMIIQHKVLPFDVAPHDLIVTKMAHLHQSPCNCEQDERANPSNSICDEWHHVKNSQLLLYYDNHAAVRHSLAGARVFASSDRWQAQGMGVYDVQTSPT